MDEANQKKVGAKCQSCGKQLTLDEFRACRGMGHYCAAHRPLGGPRPQAGIPSMRPRSPSAPKTKAAGPGRGRKLSESGVLEYTCKGQFARDGRIRAGRLTTDHPACIDGSVQFVIEKTAYGPAEVPIVYVRDPQGKALAQKAGFEVHG